MTSERKEHVDEGGFCKHCLSTVDAEGYAVAEQEQLTPMEGAETEQQSSTVAMRHNAGGDFADAVKRYAHGGEVEEAESMRKGAFAPEISEIHPGMEKLDKVATEALRGAMSAEEMKKKKAERYGRRP